MEITHPDKRTELLLYELAVDEPHRRQGTGRALIRALRELGRQRGCSAGTWVPAEADNQAAVATYSDGEAVREDGVVVFVWPGLS